MKNLKLFNDLNNVSKKYTTLTTNNDPIEIELATKLKSLLHKNSSNLDDLREKINFVHNESLNQIKGFDGDRVILTTNELNKFSLERFNLVRIYSDTITSKTLKAVINSTLDELTIINESINCRDFTVDREKHMILYHEVLSNSYATFLSIKEFIDDRDAINCLSQGIFNQMKAVAISSNIY